LADFATGGTVGGPKTAGWFEPRLDPKIPYGWPAEVIENKYELLRVPLAP
jgi:hypothetical protein